MQDLAIELVRDYRELVALPEVACQVNEMVDDPDCNVDALAEVIRQDPGLTMRLLGIANSPYYGFASEVSEVSRAIALLGMKQVRDLVISTSATRAFEGIPVTVISVEDFWQHSLYCGLLTEALARYAGNKHASLFIAGLLHDIGQLILFHRFPQQMHDAILRTIEGETPLSMLEAEQEMLGTNHSEVGAELAHNWRLPAQLVEVIACHHHPEQAQNFRQVVALVHIANAVADLIYVPDDEVVEELEVEENSWELAGINRDAIIPAVTEAREKLETLRQAYFKK